MVKSVKTWYPKWQPLENNQSGKKLQRNIEKTKE